MMLRSLISVLLLLGATWSCAGAMKASVEIMTHYPQAREGQPNDPHKSHWLLFVQFGDDDDDLYYVCEYFWKPIYSEPGRWDSRCQSVSGFSLSFRYKPPDYNYYKLGTVDTTPKQLQQLFYETEWNGGKYSFCACQKVIADVVGKLGFAKVKASLIKYMKRETDDWLKLDENGENSTEASLDSTPKRATVKLLTSNLEGDGEVLSKVGTVLTPTGEGGKHWALVVQFDGDDEVHVCELYRNSDAGPPKGSGAIDYKCERGTKEEAVRGKNGVSVFNYGTTETSPERLHKLAGEVSYNGQDYNMFLRNCQHWVTELLFKLKMDTEGGETRRFLEKTSTGAWLIARFMGHSL